MSLPNSSGRAFSIQRHQLFETALNESFWTTDKCFLPQGIQLSFVMCDNSKDIALVCFLSSILWCFHVNPDRPRPGIPFWQGGPGSEFRHFCTSSTFQHHQIHLLQDKLGVILACCWGGLVSTASPNPTHPPFICDSNICILCFFFPHGR